MDLQEQLKKKTKTLIKLHILVMCRTQRKSDRTFVDTALCTDIYTAKTVLFLIE